MRLPPGPRTPSLVQGVGFWTRPLPHLERLRARYGKTFTTRFPLSPRFVIHTEPEHIKQIYTAPPDVLWPGYGARVLTPLVGFNSVILLDEDAHMRQRKLMLPAFHGERMERLRDLMTEVTEDEVSSWGDASDIRLLPRMQSLTLEVILRAVFGLDPGPRLDALRDSLARLLSYGDSPLSLLSPPATEQGLTLTMRAFSVAGPLKGLLQTRREVDELLFAQIDERRDEGLDRDDVLSMLLEARHEDGSPMSDQELRDELMTLLAAGHETTASSLSWGFMRLAREPEALNTLVSEVDADADQSYLSATINEILRARPVLPNTLPRFVKKPIEVGGYTYEPDRHGVCLVANAYLVHHDPDIYPDPYAFRPERFLGEKPGTYTWIPFGGGRRRCLGASFALLEMKIVIAAVLRHYEVRPTRAVLELAKRRNISVYPQDGARVGLAARDRQATPA